MIVSVKNNGARKARSHANPKVAPMARAVRNALAVSATMLALTAPAIAFAGTCSHDATTNQYACNGDFALGLPEGGFVPPVDLTLVLGDALPSNVNPAAGVAGIDAAWTGDVSVLVHAGSRIGTSGADGIRAYSADGAARVSSYGNIDTTVTAYGVQALDVGAVDDVTLVNGGDAFAHDASGTYDAIAASVFSTGGDIGIDNQLDGTLGASAFDGDATGLSARAFGAYAALAITNDGVINADSVYGAAIGLFASGDDVSVQNSGSIHASGYTSAIGVDASGAYVVVDNSGTIVAEVAADNLGAYAYALPAVGVKAFASDARVNNSEYGLISAAAATDADGAWARARAVYAVGFGDGVTVDNDGAIQAHARADNGRAEAHGIYAFGYGSPTIVHNAGDIEAGAVAANGGAYATGINAIGYGSGSNNSEVVNAGSIDAESDGLYAYAFGVLNLTRQSYGSAYFTNEGDIDAEAAGLYATATGSLNLALRYGDAITTNSGTVDAIANGEAVATATGLYNYALVYDAIVDNSGSVGASATGDLAIAIGIYNASELYGGTTTGNSGDVVAHADAGSSIARAAGMVGISETTVDVTNYGSVDADAYSVDGPATAVGLYALGTQTTTVLNYGDVSARAESVNGDATAYGALTIGGFSGIGLLVNGGDLSAEASAGAGAYAYAAGAVVVADVASIFNDATASATATAGEGGTAMAIGAHAYGLNSAVSNYGELSATASAAGGAADAFGANVYGYTGAAFYNAGDIQAAADGGVANATGASSIGIFSSDATNLGTISAEATGDQVVSRGLYNASVFDAITVNEGDISAVAEGALAAYGEYEALAFGAYNLAVYYNSVIDNGGSISASASATTDISGTNGFLVAKALGAVALSLYGYGETVIANTGSITASAETSQGYAGSWGAVARSGVYGVALITNDGSISTYSKTDIGSADTIGAYAGAVAGSASIVNHGDISAHARAERGIVDVSVNYAVATGVQLFAPYGGEATLDNYGSIGAHADILGGIGYATGVGAYATYTSIHNAAGASIVATVDAELFGGAFATGIEAGGQYYAGVVNDGTVTAYGHANAYATFYGAAGVTGIVATAGVQGDASVVNNGDVNAIAIGENSLRWAQGGAGATGIHAYAKYDATVVNAGDIDAIADAQFGNVSAYGAVAHGKYSSHLTNEAGASILASATVGSLEGDQYGGRAVSFGTQTFGNGMEYAVTYNAGSIVSHAVVTPDGSGQPNGTIATAFGSAIGYNSGIQAAIVDNSGSIEAAAGADFGYATAYGAFVRTQYDTTIANSGDIRASASSAGGNAFAVGAYGFSLHQNVTYNCDNYGCDWANPIVEVDGGNALVDNSGDIVATASASGGIGYSYGVVALGAFSAGITNAGHITAVTEADDALAVGAIANAFYGDATVHNSGDIVAKATGDLASASGVMLLGTNVQLDNAGTVVAAAYGTDATATAVSMDSEGSNTLANTGTIAAIGDGERIAIASSGIATSIANGGSITGAILASGGGSLDNAAGALWHAVGESDFGTSGSIANAGTIAMDDAVIRFGDGSASAALFAAAPGTFDNTGVLAVSGAGNVLDVGLFDNQGVISFVDGAPDDVLTITGDFAGQGAINLDVSGLHQASDRLYIDGNVAASTTQTLNVNLVDLPTTASTDIALVNVSGDATAANFALGQVGYAADGFLTLDFSLKADIDASNATDDILSLNMAVTGMNDAGALASVLAPGVQDLVNAQVGTWRQRVGVVAKQGDAVFAPWLRMFSGSGDVNPAHAGNFGAGGEFGFEQSNHGWELGLEARPLENVAVGVLLADVEGRQHLRAGAGTADLDGTTFGLYGTLLGDNGLYLDVSQRWTGIDARLQTATGSYTTKASADAFNVEAGFTAWQMAGINFMPQAQYTRTRVSDIDALHGSHAEFADEGGTSSRGRVGLAVDKVFQGAGFTWTPYGSVNAVREFDGEYDHAINGGLFGTTRTEGTSAMVELGLGARKDKLSITGGVHWTDGGALESLTGGQLVVRYHW